jgi:sugar lactone lactonase YvrE
MRNLRTMDVPGNGPEDTLFDDNGNVYCSLRDEGCLVRVSLTSGQAETVADTGGAPLGLDWLPDGRLLVCNATHGLQSVDVSSGAVSAIDCDCSFGVCNNAHVLADGTIIVSDSSAQYPLAEYQKDIIENTASGRLIKVSPDGSSDVLLQGLSFANGVVCIDGGASVLVAETGTGVIRKVSVDGGDTTVFAQPPGHPDNLSIGSDGNIWVAIPSLPSKPLAILHDSPVWLRKVSSRLPEWLQPKPALCCRVIVYDANGNIVEFYNGDTGIYSFVTGVREKDGVVVLGSIGHRCIGVFDA